MDDLRFVPVERLTGPRDLFRCAPYAAVISALTCLSRCAGRRGARRCVGCTVGRW